MVKEYQISIRITNSDDTEALDTLLYLKDTFGTAVNNGMFSSQTKEVIAVMLVGTFSAAVATIQSLKTQFTTRLITCDFQVSESG